MAVTEALVKRKFKIKVKAGSAPIDSERKLCQNGSKAKVPPSGCNKRKLEPQLDDQEDNRRIMAPCVKRQCSYILDILIAHPHSWAFITPVDPVALGIPDYFSIISQPMDLGTVKSRLARNTYSTAEQFAADVKLTFSNAMLYNPPDNRYHHMARELECIFIKRWKLLEAKLDREMATAQQGILPNKIQKDVVDSGKPCSDSFSLYQRSTCPNSDCSMTTVMIAAPDARKTCSVESNANSSLVKRASKGSMSSEDKKKLKKDLMEILVGRMTEKLQTGLKKLGVQFSKKEVIDVEFDKFDDDVLRQLKRVVKDAKDNEGQISSNDGIMSGRNSLGLGTVSLDKQSPCPGSNLLDPVYVESSLDAMGKGDQDLKKALRAAMLKKRFAETISKANSDKADSRQMQQEMERLRCEEAKIKAFMRDEQMKKAAEREKGRKAARAALETINRTVDVDDSWIVWKELERLCGCFIRNESGSRVVLRDLVTGKVVNPLEQLGLRLRLQEEEFIVDDNGLFISFEREEGEMLD